MSKEIALNFHPSYKILSIVVDSESELGGQIDGEGLNLWQVMILLKSDSLTGQINISSADMAEEIKSNENTANFLKFINYSLLIVEKVQSEQG